MPPALSLRRTLALTSAVVLTSWGTLALPAGAEPGAHGKAGHHQARKSSATAHHPSAMAGSAHAAQAKPRPQAHQEPQPSSRPARPHPAPPQQADTHAPNGHASKPARPAQAGQGHGRPEGAGQTAATGTGKGTGKGSGKGAPAGNNGTVKIAPLGELDGIPQNTPHPGCTFQVEWYGFEEGSDIVSTVSFAMQAPTADVGLDVAGPSSVFVGGDPATGAGTPTGLDGQQAYTLSFAGAPHPQQGYHVKLTVSTPRSKGNDTKTKVFWVQPCEDDTTTPGDDETTTGDETTDDSTDDTTDDTTDETTGDSDTDDHTGTETTTDDSDTDESAGDTTGDTMDDQTVAGGDRAGAQGGGSVSAGDSGARVPTAVEAGEQGPVADLVTSPVPLAMIALGALLTAGAFVTRRRARAGR